MTFKQSLRKAKKVWLVASYLDGSFSLPISKRQAEILFRQLEPTDDYTGGDEGSHWSLDGDTLTIQTVS